MLKFLKEVYSEEEKAEEIEPNLGKSKKNEANTAMAVKVKPPDQNAQKQKIKQTKRQSRKQIKKMVSLLRMSTTGSTIDFIVKVQHHSEVQSDCRISTNYQWQKKVKMHLETKTSFAKYYATRVNFPRQKPQRPAKTWSNTSNIQNFG